MESIIYDLIYINPNNGKKVLTSNVQKELAECYYGLEGWHVVPRMTGNCLKHHGLQPYRKHTLDNYRRKHGWVVD